MAGCRMNIIGMFLKSYLDICGRLPNNFITPACKRAISNTFALKSKQSIHFLWRIWKHPCHSNYPNLMVYCKLLMPCCGKFTIRQLNFGFAVTVYPDAAGAAVFHAVDFVGAAVHAKHRLVELGNLLGAGLDIMADE